MADFNVTATLSTSGTSISVSPSSLTVSSGDRVRFKSNNALDEGTVTSWDSGEWTSTATLTIPKNAYSSYKTAANGGSSTVTINLERYDIDSKTTLNDSKNFVITIVATDDQANAFTFTDSSGVGISTQITSNTITVGGMDSGATATTSLGGSAGSKQVSKNGGAFTTSAQTVSNGDKLRVRCNSSGSYSSSVTCTLTLTGSTTGNTRADTMSVTTGSQAALVDNYITNPKTSPPMSFVEDIRDFFGYDGSTTSSDYFRGGAFVPNITSNNSIPTSGTLQGSHFEGGVQTIIRLDSWKNSENSISDPAAALMSSSQIVEFTEGADFTLGYASGIVNNVQAYITHSGSAIANHGATSDAFRGSSGVALNSWFNCYSGFFFGWKINWTDTGYIDIWRNNSFTIKFRHKKVTATETASVSCSFLIRVTKGNIP